MSCLALAELSLSEQAAVMQSVADSLARRVRARPQGAATTGAGGLRPCSVETMPKPIVNGSAIAVKIRSLFIKSVFLSSLKSVPLVYRTQRGRPRKAPGSGFHGLSVTCVKGCVHAQLIF